MKKIIAAFDSLRFSQATLDYTIDLAASDQAEVTGIFLTDIFYHSPILFNKMGNHEILNHQINSLLKMDEQTREQSVAFFRKSGQDRLAGHAIHEGKAFDVSDLIRSSVYADLTVIGAAETVNRYPAYKPSTFVGEFLAGAQCPVFVVPTVYHPIDRVVVLYDGHPSSVFALKMFNYLFPLDPERRVELVFVTGRSQRPLPEEKLIGEYMRCYFKDPAINELSGEPEAALVNYLRKASPGTLVVMGASSRGAVSSLFRSSTANLLMEALELPIFITQRKS